MIYKVLEHYGYSTKRHFVDNNKENRIVKTYIISFFMISYTVREKINDKRKTTSYNNIILFEMLLLTVSCNTHLDPRLNVTLYTLEHRPLHDYQHQHTTPKEDVHFITVSSKQG